MPDFDWLDVATDRLKAVGLDDAAEFLRCQAERLRHFRPRVDIDPEVHDRYASFAELVRSWADDPMPKVPGLRVSLDVWNGYDGAVLGVEVKFRAEFGGDRAEYSVSRHFKGERINGNTYPPSPAELPYPTGHLGDSLDRMHFELVTSFRNASAPPLPNSVPDAL